MILRIEKVTDEGNDLGYDVIEVDSLNLIVDGIHTRVVYSGRNWVAGEVHGTGGAFADVESEIFKETYKITFPV